MSYEEEKQDRKIEQLEAEIERLRGEMENYGDDYVCQMKSKDARIKELESSLDEAEALTKKNAELMNIYLARIAELEDALVEGLTNFLHYRASCYDPARQLLQAEGKIGPDAETGNRDHVVGPDQMVPCWQITEDRVTAIDQGLRFLEWSNAKTGNVETKKRIAILKTMLEEASDGHGFER